MTREADMIEQQIKMRGSTPGQPAGKWCVSALSELVPHFFKMPFKTKNLRMWLLCCCRNCRPMHTILFLHQNKKTATIFFFLFFLLFIFLYIPTILNNYKKKSHAHLSACIESAFQNDIFH